MYYRDTQELEKAIYQNPPKGGVAPSRYDLAMHDARLKRMSTLEAEEHEKRRQKAEITRVAVAKILSRVLASFRRLLDA